MKEISWIKIWYYFNKNNKLKNKYVFRVVSINLILSINSVDDRPRPLDCPYLYFEWIWELPTPSWRMLRLSNNEQERYSEIAHRRTRKFIKVVRNHDLISQLLKSFVFFSKQKIHSCLTIMFSEDDEALNGWYWSGWSTTSKDTWKVGIRSPTPIHFYFILFIISKLTSMPNF